MELTEIINFFKDLPFWGWIILFFVYVFIFGDRKLWEYEVKFPLEAGIGRGEIEFECFKKKGAEIEVHLQLEPYYQHKHIEILRNGISVYAIEPSQNIGKRIFIKKRTQLEKPAEGDKITVKIGGKDVFSGRLVLD
ncbi:MAG: hypothetical protein ACKE5M_07060 [Methylophilaceae bacterium]